MCEAKTFPVSAIPPAWFDMQAFRFTRTCPFNPSPQYAAARIAAMQALLDSEARRFEDQQSMQMAEPIRVDVAKYARLAQQANIKPE